MGDDELRVSDAERDAVVDHLGRAVGEGRLDLGQYEQRVGSAYAARTRGELVPLTADLPAPVVRGRAPERIATVLGNVSRKGEWDVPERLVVRSVLGDCHIELQQARLTAPVTTIEATTVLGAVTIFVPDGLDVRMSGTAVLGARSSSVRSTPRPGAPILHVIGRAYLGSVEVRTPNWWERLRMGS